MKKNTQGIQKRRQKKIARHKATRSSRLAAFRAEQLSANGRRQKLLEARSLLKDGQSVPLLSDEDYIFWLCHGANYLASDGETGLWDPLFETIYTGTLPDPESIAQTVLNRYQKDIEDGGTFGGVPRAVLAWTVSDRHIVSIYKHEAVRRLQEKDSECDAETEARYPHNPIVWSMMNKVKARSLLAGTAMDEETKSETAEQVPELNPQEKTL